MHLIRLARTALALVAAAVLAVPALAATAPAAPAKTPKTTAARATKAPALDAPFWTGHPGGPRFAAIQQERIAKAKTLIAKMKAVTGKRTIDNTLVPYDEASMWLDQAGNQSSLIENVHPDSVVRAAAEKASQDVSAYATEISLDRGVYDALSALDLSGVDEETRYYVQHELRDFKLSGVDKDDATRQRIKDLRDELVKVGQEFDRNIRDDVRTIKVKAKDLAGLPKDFVDGHPVGADGLVTLDINYPDYIPVMTYGTNDDVRRRLFMEFSNRAYPKNQDVLKHMLKARYELATTLGYPNWADYITANKMSGDAKTVRTFIDRIVTVSGAAQDRDYKTLLARKQKDVPGATSVNTWENGYWQELVRRSDYNFDSQSMRPYLPYAEVEQGMLGLTSRLFGVTFKPVPDAPVWHPSVKCYEMFEGSKLVGRIYLDMHPRPNKYNHAAQFDVRTGVEGKLIPEATLVCNLPGGEAGDPGLCEVADVQTFLHEFGHLLHALFAGHHRWVGIGGIRTEHDFVEAPSQMLEEWMRDPKTLQTFAKHYQTHEPVPTELVDRMRRSQEFAKGLQVRRQMVYADLSLSIYDRDPAKVDIDATARELVTKYQPFAYVDGTHFPCSFGHLDGYSAVYYTYMWSLVIAKDMFSAFNQDNLLDPTIATRYRNAVLAPGGSAPAAKLVQNFLGRPFGFESYQRWLDTDLSARSTP